jgi:hypothetical protein
MEQHYRRNNHAIRLIRRLKRTIVVRGMNTFNPGRSMRMSPGRRPMGSLEAHGHRTPKAKVRSPKTINTRCMAHSSAVKKAAPGAAFEALGDDAPLLSGDVGVVTQ